jgi:hypothetical protein
MLRLLFYAKVDASYRGGCFISRLILHPEVGTLCRCGCSVLRLILCAEVWCGRFNVRMILRVKVDASCRG